MLEINSGMYSKKELREGNKYSCITATKLEANSRHWVPTKRDNSSKYNCNSVTFKEQGRINRNKVK